MGKSETQQGCTKHPNEKGLPGVCSACLRERLSQLYASSNWKTMSSTTGFAGSNSSQSFSPPYSSAPSSSTYLSPVYRRHPRKAPEMMGSISFTVKVGHGLKKSRSIAFIARSRAQEIVRTGKKKGGFWSKLFWSTGKRNTDHVFTTART
ncbi:hypothetical protein CJ030_MR0G006954 [Morella rubra]|uniref:Uncharacterized protein n=1 Tax=Morella rubra TaxID=262757 RepID=A0A6A1UN17_9ROSI|nr:hypothetical protein CJ030_MR0G006954 [Morella rubra]